MVGLHEFSVALWHQCRISACKEKPRAAKTGSGARSYFATSKIPTVPSAADSRVFFHGGW